MAKARLDTLLVQRGLVANRDLAARLVMAGEVRVNDQVLLLPSLQVDVAARLDVAARPRFVSRGGEKLQAALDAFGLPVTGRICADLGASTGGFTDCLLQAGAGRVYAIDVGEGLLDWRLRQNARVVVMEGVNARFLEALPEPVSLVTIDAAFISLKVLLPAVRGWFGTEGGEVVALIKPQFEADKAEAGRGRGVIKDPDRHAALLVEVLVAAEGEGYGVRGLLASPLLGAKGNREFLAWLVYPGAAGADLPNLARQVSG